VEVSLNHKLLRSQKKRILLPGEMEQLVLKKSDLEAVENLEEIEISVTCEGK
jgi:hypothetical protein